ncbi:MAG TPA: hypothetical protein DIU39_05000 [Flavobacteriales bacterium]|nr:hypothetical protein [Flavobacteriales bacterium]
MKLKYIFISLSFLLSINILAQEYLIDSLPENKALEQYFPQIQHKIKKQHTQKALLTLPFIDDFSQQWVYPDTNLWEDFNVYINSSFADNPKSYGVATFDGLKPNGKPYNFIDPTAHGIADYLTSKPIDLSGTSDSVYLSFYYQPQGNGNPPENKDSLILEFKMPGDTNWYHQWAIPGNTNQPFQLVMIYVDTAFQKSGFQFRFKNYATLSGNVDHWNVDYIRLEDNRTFDDTTLRDVAFITDNYSMLKDFSAMPWTHYLQDTINNMATSMTVTYRNNQDTTLAVFYKYQVNDELNQQVELYPTSISSKNVSNFGYLIEDQAVYNLPANDFYFPPNNAYGPTTVFQIKNYFDLSSYSDFNQKNDTVYSYQVFDKYYAYDDGSAEGGYGVFGVQAKLAHEFTTKITDTLTAIDVYFNPISENMEIKTFKFTIWSSLIPETIIYQESGYSQPSYEAGRNGFVRYTIENPIVLPAGTYYFGWEKISDTPLNVGWDFNNDNSDKVYYNASGFWTNTSFDGSLMLRPVFGSYPDETVSVKHLLPNNYTVDIFPNPANNKININADIPFQSVEIYNIEGKQVLSSKNSKSIDVSLLTNGIYIIAIHTNTSVIRKKLLIRHP